MGSQKLKINNLIRFEFFKDVITTEGELLRKKDHTWSKKARLIGAPICGGWINPFEGRVMNPIKSRMNLTSWFLFGKALSWGGGVSPFVEGWTPTWKGDDVLGPFWNDPKLRRGCHPFWGGRRLNSCKHEARTCSNDWEHPSEKTVIQHSIVNKLYMYLYCMSN